MKIAILGGTGSIGEGFALRWAGKHEIMVCSREADKAEKQLVNTGKGFRIWD